MTTTITLEDRRSPIWAGMVDRIEGSASAVEAIQTAGFDSYIEKLPLIAHGPENDQYPSGKYLLVDRTYNHAYGIVGEDYTFLQNRELAELVDRAFTGYSVDSVGQTPSGAGIFFLLNAGEVEVAKDPITQYFLLAEMRMGGYALKQAFICQRLICQNALTTALASADTLLRARHDRSFEERATGTAKFLARAELMQREMLQRFEAMARVRINREQLNDILATTYPLPKRGEIRVQEDFKIDDPFLLSSVERANKSYQYYRERALEQRRFASDLFENFQTDDPDAKGTLWAAYNVVVEAEDHGIQRGSTPTAVHESAMWGSRYDAKVRALNASASILLNTLGEPILAGVN